MSFGALNDFVPPDWRAPLDPEPVLKAIPDSATVAGMFLSPIVSAAAARGVRLPSARDHYPIFKFFPLREHVQLIIEASAALFPELTLRNALRKLGRGAPTALLQSTLGKVTLGSVSGVTEALTAMCNTYPVNLPSCQVQVLESGTQHLIASMRNIFFFVDSHHVGVMEGAMRYAGTKGEVLVCPRGPEHLDLLCRWA